MNELVTVGPDHGVDRYDFEQALQDGQKRLDEHLPLRFARAEVTDPLVIAWVNSLVATSLERMRLGVPVVHTGPSLVLAGKAGRGKTTQAWGALRALSRSGVRCWWRMVTAAKLFQSMRPHPGLDFDAEMTGWETSSLLVIDDLGATKDTAWTDEVFDRLINTRYEWERPTLITTNVPPAQFSDKFGDRVASRLAEMATVVTFTGPDLRRERPTPSVTN